MFPLANVICEPAVTIPNVPELLLAFNLISLSDTLLLTVIFNLPTVAVLATGDETWSVELATYGIIYCSWGSIT